MRDRLNTVRGRLMGLVLLALFPFLILILLTNMNERQADSLQAQAEALRVAEQAAAEQDRQIEQIRSLLMVVSSLPGVTSSSPADCSSMMALLRAPYDFIANLGMINLDGDLVCSALPVSAPTNVSDRTYFVDALASGEFSAGDYQIGRVTGLASLNFGYPLVSDNGTAVGVVFAALDLQRLNDLAAQASLPPGSTLTVIDRQGTLLARFPTAQAFVGQPIADTALFQFLKTAPDRGTAEVNGLDGSPRLYGFTTLRAGTASVAYLAVGIPTAAAFAQANQTATRQLATLAVATLAGLILAYFGSEALLLKSIRKMVHATRALARGELEGAGRPVPRFERAWDLGAGVRPDGRRPRVPAG